MTLKEISEVFHIYYGTLLNWKKNKKELVEFLQSFSKNDVQKILNKNENIKIIKDLYDVVINSSDKEYEILKKLGIKVSSFLKKRSIIGKVDDSGAFQIVLLYKNKVVPYEKKLNVNKVRLWKTIQVEDFIDDFDEDNFTNIHQIEGKIMYFDFKVVNSCDLEELFEIYKTMKDNNLFQFWFQKMLNSSKWNLL